jgi:hypothetical protein
MGFGRPRPRKPSPVPVYSSRSDEQDADAFEARAKRLAPAIGYCQWCGAFVDPTMGRLHGSDCASIRSDEGEP